MRIFLGDQLSNFTLHNFPFSKVKTMLEVIFFFSPLFSWTPPFFFFVKFSIFSVLLNNSPCPKEGKSNKKLETEFFFQWGSAAPLQATFYFLTMFIFLLYLHSITVMLQSSQRVYIFYLVVFKTLCSTNKTFY